LRPWCFSLDSQLSIHGISFTELMVTYKLSTAPNLTMRRIELAESISLSASAVTRLLLLEVVAKSVCSSHPGILLLEF